MYSIHEYNKIASKYGQYSSWAIWDETNPKDTAIIDSNYQKLNTRYIFIGLNISRQLNTMTWSNFHDNTHARKLNYACNKTILKGSYLTDLFKDIPEPNSLKLSDSITKEIIESNVLFFKKEMEDIEIDSNTVFILLGDKVQKFYDLFFKNNFNNKVLYYRHYSSRGTDKEWVVGLWEKLGIQKSFEDVISKP